MTGEGSVNVSNDSAEGSTVHGVIIEVENPPPPPPPNG